MSRQMRARAQSSKRRKRTRKNGRRFACLSLSAQPMSLLLLCSGEGILKNLRECCLKLRDKLTGRWPGELDGLT